MNLLHDPVMRAGQVAWLGLRPARRAPVVPVPEADALVDHGLSGDHYRGKGGRGVTLIQAEHLPVIAALLGYPAVDPAVLRRNLVISGINLLALRGKRFRIGDAILEGGKPCHPCSRMEEALGRGGFHAMRGHGGVGAHVVQTGRIWRGAAVQQVTENDARPGENIP